jgi:hypothetical protein
MSTPPFIFAAVLGAALLHAGWNAVVKVGLDRFSSILLLAHVQSGLALARGAAPLIVALIGAAFLGEVMGLVKTLAVVLIAFGVVLMSWNGGRNLVSFPSAAIACALGTGGFTAAYTIVDGFGARLSGTASGFTPWMFVGEGLGMLACALATRGGGSGVESVASGLAEWTDRRRDVARFLLDRDLGVHPGTDRAVATLRETSVLFAMLVAVQRRTPPSDLLADEAYREIVFPDGRFAPPLRRTRAR